MKKAFLFLLSIISLQVQGQKIYYSEPVKHDFNNGSFSVVGKTGNKLYMFHGTGNEYYLDAYDNQMNVTAKVLLDFIPEKSYPFKFFINNGNIYLLYQSLLSGKIIQHAALMDSNGRLLRKPINIDTTKSAVFAGNRNYFSSVYSENKEQIVVYNTIEAGKELELKCTWLDADLNIKSRYKTTYRQENNIGYGDAIVTNNGNFILPIYTPIGNRGYTDYLSVLEIDRDSHRETTKEFPLNEKFVGGTYMKLDNSDNKIYIAGFYSDKKNGSYDGILYSCYDPAVQNIEFNKFIPFSGTLYSKFMERNKKNALNDYQVRQLILKQDGGFVLLAEEYYVSTRNNYSPGLGYYSFYYPAMGPSVREYHYNDILAMSYDKEGVNEWNNIIRKNQYSQEDDGFFSSYLLVNTGGTLGILYNDFNMARSKIQMTSLDAEGNTQLQTFYNDQNNGDWVPRLGRQISSREVVIPCLYKKEISFAKILF